MRRLVFRESSHTESCIDFDDCGSEDMVHFGVPRITKDGGHQCECLCHGIYMPFEEKIQGPVRKRLDDATWRSENR